MPTCRKCNSVFASKVIVDDRTRNLQNRKFCLKCSPFGKHNTRPDIDTPVVSQVYGEHTVWCVICEATKKGRGRRCYSCLTKIRRYRMKKRAVALLGGSCADCGWGEHIEALQFHHLDPDGKDFDVGRMIGYSWDATKKELLKCVLLCSRCHTLRHVIRPPRFYEEANR